MVCLIAYAYPQDWELVKSMTIEPTMSEGSFIDANTGWVLNTSTGSGGEVYQTTDGGVTWSVQRDTLGPDWNVIEFASATVGYGAADDGYVYKTIDGGSTWSMVGDTANYKEDVYCLSVVSESAVFFGGDDTSAFKTLDGGVTWVDMSAGLKSAVFGDNVDDIAFISATLGVVLNDGVGGVNMYTHDGGVTWAYAGLPFPADAKSTRIYAVDGGGDSTFVIAGYSFTQFISTNGGKTYAHTGPYTTDYSINYVAEVLDNNTIFVAGKDGNVEKTTDGGDTWVNLSVGAGETIKTVNFIDANTGFVLGYYNQWAKTTDGGATWTPMLDWPNVSFWGIALPEMNKIIMTGYIGGEMTISTDAGATWSYPDNYATGAVGALYECEFIDADNGMIAGSYGYMGRTTDGGSTFDYVVNPLDTILNKTYNALHYVDADTILAGGSTGYIVKSVDGGLTWDWIKNDGGGTSTIYDFWPISSTQVIATASSGKILLSNATLDTFTLAKDYGSMAMRAVEFRGDVGIVTSSSGHLYRTTVADWDTLVEVFTDPDGDDLYDVEFVTDSLVYVVGEHGKIYESTDAGLTWTAMTSPAVDVLDKVRYCNYKLWVGGKDGVIMVYDTTTPNEPPTAFSLIAPADGATITDADLTAGGLFEVKWTASSDPEGGVLSDYHFYALLGAVVDFDTVVTDTSNLFEPGPNGTYQWFVTVSDDVGAITSSDTFTITFDLTIVAVEENDGLPTRFAVHQNYPNPFNPATVLRYDMPQAGHVTINIYNILGKNVRTLLDENVAAGYQKAVWNGLDNEGRPVSSGIYFYQVKADTKMATKRMVLLR